MGVCKVRFNEGGRLHVPWGYVGGVQCDPVEKKPFFHAYPGRARLQLRHARLRSPLQLLPELGDVAGAARSARGRTAARHDAAVARRRTRFARARSSSSRPTTSRSSRSSGRSTIFREARAARPRHRRSSRTATARRACSSTCGRTSISTRSISRASTTGITASSADGCSRSSTPSRGCTRRRVGGDRHAARSRLQRQRRGAARPDGVPRRRLARHPVARDRVSPGLPDDGPGEHDAGDAAARGRHRRATPGFDTSTPAICPDGSATSNTRTAHGCGERADHALRLSDSGVPADSPTAAARAARDDSRAAGARAFEGQRDGISPSCRTTARAAFRREYETG